MNIFHQAEGVALDLQKEVLEKLPPRAEEQIVSLSKKLPKLLLINKIMVNI